MLHRIAQVFIRISAFLRKEIFSIMRQPQLLLTLVLGPFLILLIFGIGYRNEARKLRTMFVVDKNSQLSSQVEQYAKNLGPQLIYEGTTSDEGEALRLLEQGQLDVVAVTPDNAYQTIQNSQQAVFTLYHREIDPFQVQYVSYFGQIYIDEVNRRVLLKIAQEGQSDATNVQNNLEAARQNASAMRQAMEVGNMATAARQRALLAHNLDALSVALGASLGVLSGVQDTIGPGQDGSARSLLDALTSAEQNTQALEQVDNQQQASPEQIATVAGIEQNLSKMEKDLSQFTSIDANVLVKPFRSEAKSIARLQPNAADFFAPAVIALLLQHLAITFGALSIVRERSAGTLELFRVAPLSAAESLIGKYISFMLFGGLITVILVLLMVYGLKVPMLGRWTDIALVVAALLFTSLGFGFVISLLSQTDTQAVQTTMIMLLTSVFFSGFLMSLNMLIPSVRVLSWALPTTYGIVMLRNIFLRGLAPAPLLLWGLTGIGVALSLLAWFLMRRLLSSR